MHKNLLTLLCLFFSFSNASIGMERSNKKDHEDPSKKCIYHLAEGRKLANSRKNILARDHYNTAYNIAHTLNKPGLKAEALIGHASVYNDNNLSCFTQAYYLALEDNNLFLQCKSLIGIATNTKDKEYAFWCYDKVFNAIGEINPGDHNVFKKLQLQAADGMIKLLAKERNNMAPRYFSCDNLEKHAEKGCSNSNNKRIFKDAFSEQTTSKPQSKKKKQKISSDS